MDKRQEELTKLKSYIEGIDNELTVILQTLQWDREELLQSPALVTCRYDSNHKVPPDKTAEHEKECFLRQNGYSKDDQLLPDPVDLESNALVKLRKEDIEQIIANASRSDKLFKKVYRNIVQRSQLPHPFYIGCREAELLSLARLQSSYSADERRAIHDAVVSAAPSCHDLTDLALLSGADDKSSKVILSRQEILLELRNMRRRRAKYRVAAKSRNYSDVLRDVIRTQMEHYNDAKTETDPKETMMDKGNNQKDTHNARRYSRVESKDDRYRGRYDGKIVPGPIKIKIEREDSTERSYRDHNQRDYSRERSDRPQRYETTNRNRRERNYDRSERNDRSRERRNYDEVDSSHKYGEHSRKRRHDNESRERKNYYEDSENRRKVMDSDKEYSSERRSRNSHRHKDNDSEYERNDEANHRRREISRERRRDEKGDKAYKHKDQKDRHRDRERSKERRRDKRYEERSGEGIHIKQEREDSVTRDETDVYDIYKSKDSSRKKKDKRNERSYGDHRNYGGHSVEVKQEKYDRYYDVPSEEIYDPHKKIKVEK